MNEQEINSRFEEIEKRLNKLELPVHQDKKISKVAETLEEKIKKLCDDAKIERRDFDDIFFIKENQINILVPIDGKKESDKHLKVVLLILTVNDYLLETDFIKSSDLGKILKKLGISSIVNLSTNLSKKRKFLLPEGKAKSKNFGFRITIPGKYEGLKIIKELAENGQEN